VLATRPGSVQRVAVDALVHAVEGHAERVAITVCAGDFASVETPIAEVWPREAAERCRDAVQRAISVASERDLDQDVGFGIRQLTDTALKAISPSVNDPTTAVTCIGYLRSILVRLTERALPPRVRRFPESGLTVIVRERRYEEHLEALLQLNRYVAGDAWVAGELLRTVDACLAAADRCGAAGRARSLRAVAATIGQQFRAEAGNDRDRDRIAELAAGLAGQAPTRAR
jgi:uncharacterized membrane protein